MPVDAEKATVASSSNATANNPSFPAPTPRPRRIADPLPLGLYAFSSTLLVLSLYNVRARHISVPNVVVGMAIFYGGLAQFLAGMWSFACANVLGATAFSTYGAFWMGYATLQIPSSGSIAAYSDPDMLANAIGVMLLAFMIVSLLFTIACLRQNVAFIVLFAALIFLFSCLAAAEFTRNSSLTKAAGYFGIVAALAGYYSGTAVLLAHLEVANLPLGVTYKRRD